MNKVRLSICIPVYNFGAFIGETLESIISQASDEIEIVVVDGDSTDNTTEIIQGYQRTFPRLHYHRLAKRGGIDKDMAMTVEFAHGEYCWLFGGEILDAGAIAKVLVRFPWPRYFSLRVDCMPIGHDAYRKISCVAYQYGQVFDLPEERAERLL